MQGYKTGVESRISNYFLHVSSPISQKTMTPPSGKSRLQLPTVSSRKTNRDARGWTPEIITRHTTGLGGGRGAPGRANSVHARRLTRL